MRAAFGVLAHTVALTEAVDWLDDHRRALDGNRQFLGDQLAARPPGVGYQVPEATFLRGWTSAASGSAMIPPGCCWSGARWR